EEGEDGRHPPGWLFPYEAIRAGYHLSLRRGGPCRRGGCAEVAADPIATPRFVHPAEVLEVDLGSGVTAALPVTLYADARGTLPHADPGASPPLWASVDAAADTRSARLAAVATLWGLLEHLHPELDVESAEWRAALPEALAEAAAAPDRAAFANVLRKLLVPLRDDKANFLSSRNDPEPRLLPIAWELVEGRLAITGVAPGAGDLRPGDVIAALDGRPSAEVLAEAVARTSGATPESRSWLALDLLAAGPPGSSVTLRIERPGAAPFEIALPRSAAYGEVSGTPLAPVAEPRPGILYVDLGRITEEGFNPLLPRLAAAKGVVFDLRRGANVSNVLLSHLTDRTAMSSSWQLPVVMRPDHRDVQWLTTFWNIEPRAPRLRNVAFLVDARCTGYCETLLAMIEHHRWAAIVGERSGASNGSVNRATLPGGWSAAWTAQRVLKHDGSPFHGVGVAPTVPAARTLRGIAEGRDEGVERAVRVVLR
ncbi:MAG TPA: S41 family peptidase, partial [Thermoanaerobaculia bacterium]|nr:S41 family peptidase [Thermoanaerobaculia bacterium]